MITAKAISGPRRESNFNKSSRQRIIRSLEPNTDEDSNHNLTILAGETSSNTSVDVIKYFQALNYINEVHTAINEDIRRLQRDKCNGCWEISRHTLSLPILPNYLGILATFDFKEQRKCVQCATAEERIVKDASTNCGASCFERRNETHEKGSSYNKVGELHHKQHNYAQKKASNMFYSSVPNKTTTSSVSKGLQVCTPMTNIIANISESELNRYASELLLPSQQHLMKNLPDEPQKFDKSSQVNFQSTPRGLSPESRLSQPIHSATDTWSDKRELTKGRFRSVPKIPPTLPVFRCDEGNTCVESNHTRIRTTVQKLNDAFEKLSRSNGEDLEPDEMLPPKSTNRNLGDGIPKGMNRKYGNNKGGFNKFCDNQYSINEEDCEISDSDIRDDSDDVRTMFRGCNLVSS